MTLSITFLRMEILFQVTDFIIRFIDTVFLLSTNFSNKLSLLLSVLSYVSNENFFLFFSIVEETISNNGDRDYCNFIYSFMDGTKKFLNESSSQNEVRVIVYVDGKINYNNKAHSNVISFNSSNKLFKKKTLLTSDTKIEFMVNICKQF